MRNVKDVDEYIFLAPKEVQERLRELRAAIKDSVPEAEERISYSMPYYAYKGRLVYFAYAKKHIGIYAIFEPVRAEYRSELKGYEMSKGAIRFPLDEKLPLDLIKKMVKLQAKKNEEAKEEIIKSG
jgi:uncharacterized protein YdhG (YjbR/CyaY superfamily)